MRKEKLSENIAKSIENQILNGTYQSKLPGQQHLADKFNVSRVTLSKALDILAAKGLISKINGHPAIINRNCFDRYLTLDSVKYHFGLQNKLGDFTSIHSHIISFSTRTPTEKEQLKLHINENDLVYDIIRQRLIQNKPFRLEYTIMPVKTIPHLTIDVLNDSIYSFIEQKLNLKIGKANRVISADIPDAYDQKYLNCTHGEPVLKVEQVVFLEDGTPFEFSESRARYDKEQIIADNV